MELTIKVLKDGDKKVYFTHCDASQYSNLYYTEKEVRDFVDYWL